MVTYMEKKGRTTKKQIATEPALRTRENNTAFGPAGLAGKILHTSMRGLLQNASPGKMVSRLTTGIFKVLQAATTNIRGMRNVIDGETGLLQGFGFNLAEN